MYALLFILVGIIALFVLTFFNSIFEKIKAEKRAIKLAQEQVERKLAEGKAAQTLAEEQLARTLADKDKEVKAAVEDAGQSKRELLRIREAYGTVQKNKEEVEKLQKIIDGTMKDYPIIADVVAD